jgi:osmotically-inducible protein OsmY
MSWFERESTMSDFNLRRDILEELNFEPRVDPAHIGVVVDQGVVTLTGHVSSYAEKLAAEQAVRRIRGVRAIAEEIEVRVPSHKKTADDEIAKRVLDILRWDSVLPENAIRITVQDGWVNLEGEVDWQFQRAAAQNQVGKLSGLVGIINNITLKARPQSPEIRHHIETALRRNAKIDAAAIRVSVLADGQVVLAGEVRDWTERNVAEDAAWSIPGVSFVENHLTVL